MSRVATSVLIIRELVRGNTLRSTLNRQSTAKTSHDLITDHLAHQSQSDNSSYELEATFTYDPTKSTTTEKRLNSSLSFLIDPRMLFTPSIE